MRKTMLVKTDSVDRTWEEFRAQAFEREWVSWCKETDVNESFHPQKTGKPRYFCFFLCFSQSVKKKRPIQLLNTPTLTKTHS